MLLTLCNKVRSLYSRCRVKPALLSLLSLAVACARVNVDVMMNSSDGGGGTEVDPAGTSDLDTDIDGDTDADSDSDTVTDADIGTDTEADTDTDADDKSDTDTDMDVNSDTDAGTRIDTDIDSDTDIDTDTDSDTDSDTDADTDTDADSDTYPNSDTGTNNTTDTDDDTKVTSDSNTHNELDTSSEIESSTGEFYGLKILSIIQGLIPESYEVSLMVLNGSGEPVPLGELRIRYYYTVDTAMDSQSVSCWGWSLETSCRDALSGDFVETTGVDADYYLELSFNTLETIAEDGGSLTIDIGFRKHPESNFEYTNDWSYFFSEDYVENSKITLYRSGDTTPVWGEEP